ncbi:MAG TPA: hypothetical protein VKO63_01940 [Chitinispirillaceae bacterium]|nr:hypothetical protein [Chitinispirillaceae bacterium]
MTTEVINESGMTFGPYPDGMCFYIEKSELYSNVKQGVQIAEFLLLKHQSGKPVIWVVEAKSSSPRPETKPNFDTFISEIREKMVNAFSLGWAAILGRHDADELSESFNTLELKDSAIRFVLIIKNHNEAWLPPLQDALKIALHSTIKTWSLSPLSVLVMNENIATKHGLILPHSEASF